MLKQDAITPLYVQLMEELETSIRNGVYKPGDKIMTEAEMAKEYGVSLITVRKGHGGRGSSDGCEKGGLPSVCKEHGL